MLKFVIYDITKIMYSYVMCPEDIQPSGMCNYYGLERLHVNFDGKTMTFKIMNDIDYVIQLQNKEK